MNGRRDALLLLAHGSRDPQWRKPFERLRRRLAARLDGVLVQLAFLELAAPGFDEAMARVAARGRTRVRVVPLFLARGRHLRRDVAARVARSRRRYPGMEIRQLPALGEAPGVLEAIAAWIARQAARPPRER
ncbi:MAG TPA: CbiX/SirB N-terminal domain-containing protein [Burkholderiales bacterium]